METTFTVKVEKPWWKQKLIRWGIWYDFAVEEVSRPGISSLRRVGVSALAHRASPRVVSVKFRLFQLQLIHSHAPTNTNPNPTHPKDPGTIAEQLRAENKALQQEVAILKEKAKVLASIAEEHSAIIAAVADSTFTRTAETPPLLPSRRPSSHFPSPPPPPVPRPQEHGIEHELH